MYDLEERTLNMAIEARHFARRLPKSISNIEDAKQLIRASGSIGANYIEANEALSRKDFIMRLRISRKEAKETIFWLKIILEVNELTPDIRSTGEYLLNETGQIRNILSSIINKSV